MIVAKRTSQTGAVSLFIVIFTALLVTIVATSFIQIMLKNQQQASNNDLSQSAYESALAGVEDAKRALVQMKDCDRTGAACGDDIRTALNKKTCNSLKDTGIVVFNGSTHEVQVGSADLNQAYTCVKVTLDTKYVEGNLDSDGASTIVRLASEAPFDTVRISWFTPDDVGGTGIAPTFYDQSNLQKLPPKSSEGVAIWGEKTPPILRTQLLEFTPGVTGSSGAGSLDSMANLNRTLFLYPYDFPGGSSLNFDSDGRTSASGNIPQLSGCETDFSSSLYLCQATIALPSDANQKYLQLSTIYNHANYRIELLNSGLNVYFHSVQPEVDATGRASDLFRRVKARVSIDSMPSSYPNAALSIGGNLCKNFFVTNDSGDYRAECSP